jgi:hypothetical protein
MDLEVMVQKCRGSCNAKEVAAGQRVRDHVIFTSLVRGGEIVTLQLSDPPVVFPVGAAGSCASKKILKSGVIRKQVELMAMKPWAEVLHCPGDCQALALCGAVAALHIRKDAAGVPDGLMAAI